MRVDRVGVACRAGCLPDVAACRGAARQIQTRPVLQDMGAEVMARSCATCEASTAEMDAPPSLDLLSDGDEA